MKNFYFLLAFLFSWQLNAQLTYDNTCSTSFDDISTTGTALGLGDDGEANVTMPFSFTLDGVTSSDLRIGNNGGVLFNTTLGNVSTSSTPSSQGFYPFSDDLDSDYGDVYYETLGTAPNRRFVILWNDRPHYSNSPSGATFEVILYETTNEITFLYQDTIFDDSNDDAVSAGIRVVGANGAYVYSTNTALAGVTCINWTVPPCIAPSSLTTANITATSADLGWQANSGESQWEIEYGADGFSQGSGTTVSTSSNPYSLSGLSENTAYDFYVRADCGGDGTSDWAGPFSFTTEFLCPSPTSLDAGNITSSSAELSWTQGDSETAWEIEYGADGFSQGSGTTVSTSSNPYSLSGLSESTAYDFYVRADCGGNGTSVWVGPYSFSTGCNGAVLPFSEGFESGYTDNATLGGCWTQESISGSNSWTANNTSTSYNRAPRTGNWNAYLRYGNTDWMFIPVELTGGTEYLFEMYARQDGATATNASITVAYGTSNSETDMSNTIVADTGLVNGDYQLLSGLFTPATTGTYFIGIKGTINSSPWYISVDDISLKEAPECFSPTDISVSNLTGAGEADVSWTAQNGETSWDIEYGVSGFTQGSGTLVSGVSANPYTLTGLSGETDYDVYVRSNCSASDISDWTGPFTFTSAVETTPMTGGVGIDTENPETTLDVVGGIRALNRDENGILYECNAIVEGVMGYDTTDKKLKVCADNNGTFEWRAVSFE